MATMNKTDLEEITGNFAFPLFIKRYPFYVEGEFSNGQCFLRGLHVGFGDGTFYIDYAGTLRVPDCGTELKDILDKCSAQQDNESIKRSIQVRGPMVPPTYNSETYNLYKYDLIGSYPKLLEKKENLTAKQISEIIVADPQGTDDKRYKVSKGTGISSEESFSGRIPWQDAPEIAKLIDPEMTPRKPTVLDLGNFYAVCSWDEVDCAPKDAESMCFDPVNEWVFVLMHESKWGEMYPVASHVMSRFALLAWSEDGYERPWISIPDADRQEICDLIVEAGVDRTEQFSKLTELLKGLLWPGFWSEREEYTWSQINSMIESM